ncbi:hypothetical protein Stsp02_62510 [Streptomyces sp. NBRC 14336]|nr:hypothetical protein Stsp02_62510 [Streptomyces sp. NBRC 14336]
MGGAGREGAGWVERDADARRQRGQGQAARPGAEGTGRRGRYGWAPTQAVRRVAADQAVVTV